MSHDKSTADPHPVLPEPNGGRYAMNNRGFTIVELIVVSAVLAILTFMAFPAYDEIKDRVRVARAMEEIRGIERVISAWSIDRGGALPGSLTEPGLNLGFIKDPWGNDYEYHLKTEPAYTMRYFLFSGDMSDMNKDYDLFSKGVNGQTDADISDTKAQDDILRTNDGSWVGVAIKAYEGML